MTASAALRQGSGIASSIVSRRSDPWTANRAASAAPAIHDVLIKQPLPWLNVIYIKNGILSCSIYRQFSKKRRGLPRERFRHLIDAVRWRGRPKSPMLIVQLENSHVTEVGHGF